MGKIPLYLFCYEFFDCLFGKFKITGPDHERDGNFTGNIVFLPVNKRNLNKICAHSRGILHLCDCLIKIKE
jgi:hypothetical protein